MELHILQYCMLKIIFYIEDVSGHLGRNSLWFDSCKRQPPLSDHLVLAIWVVAYRRFDCIWFENRIPPPLLRFK